MIDIIKARRIAMIQALEDARNDAPLGDDEHYESDEYYVAAIATLTDLITEIEEK
jgi:hypothetical protein